MSTTDARRRVLVAMGCAVAAAILVLLVRAQDHQIAPGSRHVAGLGGRGTLAGRAVVHLPGVARHRARTVEVDVSGADALGIGLDGEAVRFVPVTGGQPLVVQLPAAPAPGARIELRRHDGPAPRVEAIRVRSAPPSPGIVVAGAIVAALAVVIVPGPIAPLAVAVTGLAAVPVLELDGTAGLLLAGLSVALFVVAWRRARSVRPPLYVVAIVFGVWVRVLFATSSGSWDTEYWKAYAARAATAGVTHAYGGPDAVPPGRWLAQARGEEPLWTIRIGERDYTIDNAPLAIALWRWSLGAAGWAGLDAVETANLGAKLPALVGDVVACLLLGTVLPARLRLGLAVLYWVAPPVWLSSAVAGFLDGALAPLVLLALVAAARGRPAWAGAWLAVATLVKITAVIAGPAIALAVVMTQGRRGLLRAAAAGLGVAAAVLLPFALAGTLPTMAVHVLRMLPQRTLSGGFPNVWWLVGHGLDLAAGTARTAVRFVPIDATSFPVRPVGTVATALFALLCCRAQWGRPGLGPAALAAASLYFGYAMLAIGVHENHPHVMVLLLLATGLATRRLRWLAAALMTSYAVNMLFLTGLGRFHGTRHASLLGAAAAVASWRTAPGFDLTLVLALVNVVLLVALAVALPAEAAALAGTGPGYDPRPPGDAPGAHEET